MSEKKTFRKANLVYEDFEIKPGHTIKLYGKETIVQGFHASYNDALGRWETIILTDGRGDPFERSLSDIEVMEDQPDESPTEQPVREVEFANWIIDNKWQPRITGEWAKYETLYSDVSVKTTTQLYSLFKEQKEK